MTHDGDRDGYIVRVQVGDASKEYKTRQFLASHSDDIIGRACRVWEAQAEGPGNGVVAIKDLWVDSESEREHEIQKAIFARFDEEFHEEKASLAKEMFFRLESGWDVVVAERKDTTRHMIEPLDLPEYGTFSLAESSAPVGHDCVESDPTSISARFCRACLHALEDRKKIQIKYRTHYRLVMKEVATPLSQVPTLPRVFATLTQLTTGIVMTSLCPRSRTYSVRA